MQEKDSQSGLDAATQIGDATELGNAKEIGEATEIGSADTSDLDDLATRVGAADTRDLDDLATRVGDEAEPDQPQAVRDFDAEIEAARAKGVLVRDRFILMASLGAGGMGHVFQARDIRREEAGDSNSMVAIKFLNADFSKHSSALISLQQEARKTQELAHPNIVTVYDFDREGDRVFMTMEYLDGAPLSALDKLEEALGKKFDRVDLLMQIAKGLAYAHSRHYVHSDLKPDNVFITNEGRIKVLDFGIARMTAEAGRSETFDAGSLGALTPRYASLEMLQGAPEPHPSDDVYALGVMGWQLFSGEHPYGRLTALEALDRKVEIPPLQKASTPLRRALTRAISLERKNRQTNAGQFLDDFKGVQRRNRIVASLAAVVVLASAVWVYLVQQPVGPDIPFSELPAQVQEEFTAAMARGADHAAIGDWDGALNYYDEAWQLHPRNADANEALDEVAEHLLGIEGDMNRSDGPAYLAAIQRLRRNRHLEAREDLAALEARWTY